MKRVIKKIEQMEISVWQWAAGFAGIVFVRFLLESISNPSSSGVIASDPQTLVHYALFYLMAAFGSILIIDFFVKKGPKMANLMLFFLILMWLAPIFDAIFSSGKGFQLVYIFDSGAKLLKDFLTFYGPSFLHGATLGVRLELALAFTGSAWFVWFETKSFFKTFAALLCMYAFVFFITAFPGIIFTIHSFFQPSILQTGQYLSNLIFNSNLAFNSVHSTLLPYSQARFLELGFDKLLSQIFFIALCVLIFLWFWKTKKNKVWAIFKNSRPERAGHYLILLFLGMWFSYVAGLGKIWSWIDLAGIICLFVAWFCVWIFSVEINDIADFETDKISNSSRPLVQKSLTENDMRQSAAIFLGLALLGAWSAGFYQFYMVLVFIAVSYIYSAKPLRLKTIPIMATFLMALASLSSVLAGFFFISKTKVFYAFPPLAMLGILLSYTLLFNAKDLKDVEGDGATDSLTIPVIFGKEKGVKIVAVMFGLSFLLVPLFFKTAFLYFISVPASIIGYFLVSKFPDKEKRFAVLYFCYLLSGLILFL